LTFPVRDHRLDVLDVIEVEVILTRRDSSVHQADQPRPYRTRLARQGVNCRIASGRRTLDYCLEDSLDPGVQCVGIVGQKMGRSSQTWDKSRAE